MYTTARDSNGHGTHTSTTAGGAPVANAIVLGVDRGVINVINFSIPGGTDPYADPVELAFLDAYAAGVFVAASAGNDGPGEGTVNHVSPWLTSAAASTQERAFESTLTVVGADRNVHRHRCIHHRWGGASTCGSCLHGAVQRRVVHRAGSRGSVRRQNRRL